eukprot:4993125-Pleurochrysis_carterae.AAC.5
MPPRVLGFCCDAECEIGKGANRGSPRADVVQQHPVRKLGDSHDICAENHEQMKHSRRDGRHELDMLLNTMAIADLPECFLSIGMRSSVLIAE